MTTSLHPLDDTGLEVNDIRDDPAFAARRIHVRDVGMQTDGMRRLVRAILARPHSVLQELVDIAVELCGADSAGISIEQPFAADEKYYHWVAAAGQYSGFLDAILPRYPSGCGICLERSAPQHFRVRQRFFDILGIHAPLVTDGILLPWEVDGTRGTIFVMAHQRSEAFDLGDCRLMELLADFAALAFRQRRHQIAFLKDARRSAAAAMSDAPSQQVSNPLQSLVHVLYLDEAGVKHTRIEAADNKDACSQDACSQDARSQDASGKDTHEKDLQPGETRSADQLQYLSELVNKLLSIPYLGLEAP